ncbi:MAG TPA: hypothetical protein VG325_06320 [Solirubrobacteraceae bacterium]|jgi:hypothetical protein|nr:hypothetical protein [Solirubrobacteraceae bacterium]
MSVLAIVDTVLLVIAIVYIVALLRSHADILRRLAILEEGGVARAPAADAVGGGEVVTAGAINGTTLDGDSVTLSFGIDSPVTLLAFLTSGCTSCAPLWAGLRESGELEALAGRVVVITHDSTRESPSRVRRLAPSAAEVVMSTRAWEDYAVPASPHFVLTDGRGGIRGRGTALSWSQLETMVDDARDDADSAAPASARSTEERAARSEQTLARSGIGPGHPSLFPNAAGRVPDEER